jgi:hypothetical protein
MEDGEKKFITETLHVGKAHEGYWTSDHVIKQVKTKLIEAFKQMHPGCVGLFTFDQSTNHAAYADNALRASKMQYKPGGKQAILRDGWFGDRSNVQSMIFPMDHIDIKLRGAAKGLRQVLKERALFENKMQLDCGVSLDIGPKSTLLKCCARHCMATNPDFLEQKSVLEETIREAGFICLFLPKFHCELNPIESYWGAAKRFARANCDYSWDALIKCVPRSLESVSLTSIRKFFCRCSHLIQAYHHGFDMTLAKYAHKKYKSHRRIPASVSQ